MKKLFKDKRVLFITTKNLDYIRNTQEIEIVKSNAQSYSVIGSDSKSYIKRIIYVYWKLLITKCKKYDVIFIGFSPQLISPFWQWKFKKSKVVIDFFISVYDTLVFDRRKFKETSIISKMLKKLDIKTIKSADKVISDTKAHGKYFIDEFGLDESKLKVLYLEANKQIYTPMNIEKPLELKDKFIVLYFGSILPLQGIDVVLEAADILKMNKKIHFIIIGPIQDKYNKVISDTITYIDWLSQEQLAKHIAFADLCLAGHFNKDINKAKRTIPGKAYIYEAMNKAMILGDNEATHELYSENDEQIYFVKMGDAQILADKISELGGKFCEVNNSNSML